MSSTEHARHPVPKRRHRAGRQLQGVLEMVANGDAGEEPYWRRVYAERHP
jgi:hypothetical protein